MKGTPMKVTVKAFAKINLMLDILKTLPNGFHDLFMLMQSVSLFDTVSVQTTESGKIEISCDNPAIPTGEKNIAYKAAEAFFEETGIQNPGVLVSIEKRIPHAAGLAGGSADAAGTVCALKKLFSPELSDKELIKICAKVGSDVPFCALGGTMLAQYTGTVLSYLPDLKLGKIIIVKPEMSVSTGEAYRAFDTAEKVRHLDRDGMLFSVMNSDTDGVCSRVENVFEQFIDVPERVVIKAEMRKHNCSCCCMSGSGPSVFGVFKNEADAHACFASLKKKFGQVFLCDAVKSGTAIID
mgnify:CR=1 FL=1